MASIERRDVDLHGRTILVVEDEFIVGFNLCNELGALGAEEAPLCGTVQCALQCIAASDRIDAAIVDLNLGGTLSMPVIDALLARNIPTILCTGCEACDLEPRLATLPHCAKPFTRAAFLRQLSSIFPPAPASAGQQ